VLSRASSLFYEAELGSFATRSAAEARWKQLVATNRLAGIDPAYAAVGAETRLTVGPLASEAAVEALCVELSSLTGACRVVAPIRAY
jgi:cell division septation protein DedD